MAGLRGNQAYFLAGVQEEKGKEAAAWQDAYPFSGGNIAPTHSTDQLSETDNTRDAGDFFVQQTAVEGAPETYIRDTSIHHPLQYVLGAAEHAKIGETSNYTHTITPAASLPYVTFGKSQGALLFEQYNDCKVDELSLAWATGSPGTAALSVMGLSAVRQAAAWEAESEVAGQVEDDVPAFASAAPLNFNKATIKLGGAETRLISSFECTISNGLSLQQTDDSVPYDVVEGVFSVTLGFDYIFESLAEYNKFHYGEASGTKQSPDIYKTSAEITLEGASANNKLKLTFPEFTYQEFPVEPDPGGAPVTVAARGAAQRHASGFVTAVVTNQLAT